MSYRNICIGIFKGVEFGFQKTVRVIGDLTSFLCRERTQV